MAEQDPSELVVASHGDMYVADYGETLPDAVDDDVEALGFQKVGYISEDGVTFGWSPTVEEFFAWQSRTAVRREMTTQEYTLAAQLEQWNSVNLSIAFGGGDVTDEGGGTFRFDFLDDVASLAEKSVIVDWQDGDKEYRLVVTRASVVDGAEINLTRSQLAMLPLSFKVLAATGAEKPAFLLTNDPAFVATGS